MREMREVEELRRQARTIQWVQHGQGCRMRGTGENKDGGMGFQSTGGAEEDRDQSYPLMIGIVGSYRKKNEVVKGYFCRAYH